MLIFFYLKFVSDAGSSAPLFINVRFSHTRVLCQQCAAPLGEYNPRTNWIHIIKFHILRIEPYRIMDHCGGDCNTECHPHQQNIAMEQQSYNYTEQTVSRPNDKLGHVQFYNVRGGKTTTVPCPRSFVLNSNDALAQAHRDFHENENYSDAIEDTGANVEVETSHDDSLDVLDCIFHIELQQEPSSSAGFYSREAIFQTWIRTRAIVFGADRPPPHIGPWPPASILRNVSVSPPSVDVVLHDHTYTQQSTLETNEPNVIKVIIYPIFIL